MSISFSLLSATSSALKCLIKLSLSLSTWSRGRTGGEFGSSGVGHRVASSWSLIEMSSLGWLKLKLEPHTWIDSSSRVFLLNWLWRSRSSRRSCLKADEFAVSCSELSWCLRSSSCYENRRNILYSPKIFLTKHVWSFVASDARKYTLDLLHIRHRGSIHPGGICAIYQEYAILLAILYVPRIDENNKPANVQCDRSSDYYRFRIWWSPAPGPAPVDSLSALRWPLRAA